jgi:thiol-disulfide isomerase/thioredoxin
MNRASRFVFAVASLALLPRALSAQAAEQWSGSTTVHGQSIPVHLSLSSSTKEGAVKGSFVNALQQSPASSGELKGSHLILNFDYFARKLEGDFHDGTFTGTYGGEHGEPAAIELHPDRDAAKPVSHEEEQKNKLIRGDWEIAVKSPKGESAWTLRVSPSVHGQIKAVILRIDGDTNGLYGGYNAEKGEYEVSHFSAAGPALYTFKPQPDGTLIVTNPLRDDQQWTARRPEEARKEGLAPPTKATEQTSVADAKAPFHFSAVDLDGKPVANTDPRFRGKVVIVAVGGSWCPNCHDEAPFLVELYNRYHSRGLEIVNINFEDEAQLKNPTRLRAFVARYHIPYTVLLGGTQAQVNEKLPQGKNLNCWPTTFFLGRDGLVKEVHAGFSGPETGAAYVNLKTETDTLLGKLLAQRDVASR